MLPRSCLLLLLVSCTRASVFSGAEDVCSLAECRCSGQEVHCQCSQDSSFQESFVFIDRPKRLRHLTVSSCPRLVLPAQAVSAEAQLRSITIRDVRHVEVHPEAVVLSSLRELNISSCELVTFQSHALKSHLTDNPVLDLRLTDVEKAEVKGRAFSSLNSFVANNVAELSLEQHAFQLKVNTDQPTISIRFINVSTPSLSSSVFPSSFKSISIEHSRIEKIATNAFSGLFINNISFTDSTIQRIERRAFSNTAAISRLSFCRCNISSLSQKSVVAGVSSFLLTHSEIQSTAKHGAINATVASVRIEHNIFKTFATESFQFVAWDEVIISNNTFNFVEEGAIYAIKEPSEDSKASFTFTNNHIVDANQKSLVTQIPASITVAVSNNSFRKKCDCSMDTYIKYISGSGSGFSAQSNTFADLTAALQNTSSCRLKSAERQCFSSTAFSPLAAYQEVLCQGGPKPACAKQQDEEQDDVVIVVENSNNMASFEEQFIMLFQVKTTKGILLFLLFCVLSSVATVTICVAAIWVHRLCGRAKLPRDHMSGSFQFNSGEEKQVLYGSDQTNLEEEEPQYAEIAEVHPCPKDVGHGTLAQWVTLPHHPVSPFHTSTMETTLPSLGASTLPMPTPTKELEPGDESTSLLSGSLETTQVSRLSMSETSLTDEIMLALRDKLNDPNMYMSVLDAKAGLASPTPASPVKALVKEEELYCSPLYSDPLNLH